MKRWGWTRDAVVVVIRADETPKYRLPTRLDRENNITVFDPYYKRIVPLSSSLSSSSSSRTRPTLNEMTAEGAAAGGDDDRSADGSRPCRAALPGDSGNLHHLSAPTTRHQRRPRRRLQPHGARGARDEWRRFRVSPRWTASAAAGHGDNLVAPSADGEARSGRLLKERRAQRALHHLAAVSVSVSVRRRGHLRGRGRAGPGVHPAAWVSAVDNRGDGLAAAAARHRGHAGGDDELARALGAGRDEAVALVELGRWGLHRRRRAHRLSLEIGLADRV